MGEWKEYKLKDLLAEKGYIRGPFGSSLKRAEMKSEGIPVYEQQHAIYNIRDFRFFIDDTKFSELRRFAVKANDLLISCSGTLGKVSIIKESDPRGIISQALLLLRPDTRKIFPEYLLYFFKTINGFNQLVNASHGSVQQNIAARDVVENIPLSIPDKNIQQGILAVLSSLDDKIDLLHRQNKTLEALAETLFRQWFVEEAEEGWETGKLGDYASVTTGKGLKRNEFFEDGKYPVLGANGEIGRTNNYLTDDRLILTGRVGTLGKVYISEDKVWISDNVLIVRPESIFFYPVYFILKRTEFENLNVGSTQPLVTQTDLKNIEFKLPSADILESYEKQCLTYFEKISKNKVQIRTLTRLRDTLLPKLMSGDVRVKDAERVVEANL